MIYVGKWLHFGILHCVGEGIDIYHATIFGRFFSIKLPVRK
jgi:hypothetical protein